MLGFRVLKPQDRPKLFEYFEDYGVKPPKILVSDDDFLNAFGGFPKVIIVTSKMFEVLDDEELFAVILHEMGHKNAKIKYYVFILFILYFIAIISGAALISFFVKYSAYVPLILSSILFISVRVGMPAAISWYQKKAEFYADCYASKVLKENRQWIISALRKSAKYRFGEPIYTKILLILLLKPFEETHPSIEDRIRNIESC